MVKPGQFPFFGREQLNSLMNLKWPDLMRESVPWALHTPLCSLQKWSPLDPATNQASSLPSTDMVQVPEPSDVDMDGGSGISKEEVENAREDGELPSLVSSGAVVKDVVKVTSQTGPYLEHSSIRLDLISKSMVSPTSKSKSLSFRK